MIVGCELRSVDVQRLALPGTLRDIGVRFPGILSAASVLATFMNVDRLTDAPAPTVHLNIVLEFLVLGFTLDAIDFQEEVLIRHLTKISPTTMERL